MELFQAYVAVEEHKGKCTNRMKEWLCAALAVDMCVGKGWVLLHPRVYVPWEVTDT